MQAASPAQCFPLPRTVERQRQSGKMEFGRNNLKFIRYTESGDQLEARPSRVSRLPVINTSVLVGFGPLLRTGTRPFFWPTKTVLFPLYTCSI